jgi:hypothetical protein
MRKVLLGLMAALLVLLAVALAPLPIRPYLDFQVLYHADLGLLRGIPIYDHIGQVNMIARLANVAPAQVFVLPFPYPPWYALSTLWLALLPIDLASRVWFGLNLIFLFLALWVMTDGLRVSRRFPLSFLGIIFLPVLGSLFVGQFGFPVLLGAVLLSRALERKQAALTALAAALLTFKPNLGALIILIMLVYLWRQKDDFSKRALVTSLILGVILFAVGFLASPLWPLDYFHSLSGFQSVSQCHQCASLPMTLAALVGGGFSLAVPLGLILLVLLAGWLVLRWKQLSAEPGLLVAAGILVTLLVSPYLQNYDFVLLLIPFIVSARAGHGRDWIWLAVAYALPLVALPLYGPGGNLALVLSALILFIHVARRLTRTGELTVAS